MLELNLHQAFDVFLDFKKLPAVPSHTETALAMCLSRHWPSCHSTLCWGPSASISVLLADLTYYPTQAAPWTFSFHSYFP